MLSVVVSGYAKCGVRWKNANSMRAEAVRVAREHPPEQLARRLHGALRPARLLRAERAHVFGQLGGGDDVLAVHEAPARELRAVAEIEVLGQRVVLPAARLDDGALAPDAARAGEVEEPPRGRAHAVLDEVVAVEHQRRDAREDRVVAAG